MKSQVLDNQLVKLKDFQKKHRLTGDEIAKMLGISRSLLIKMYSGDRTLTPELQSKIESILEPDKNIGGVLLKEDRGKYAKASISTVEEDMVKTLNLTGESPELQLYKKLEYLLKIGDMRDRGQLDEEEFIKIRNKLVELM